MADTKPWIDWSWLKVGPVLTNDEQRKAYEKRRAAEGPTTLPSKDFNENIRNFEKSMGSETQGVPASSMPLPGVEDYFASRGEGNGIWDMLSGATKDFREGLTGFEESLGARSEGMPSNGNMPIDLLNAMNTPGQFNENLRGFEQGVGSHTAAGQPAGGYPMYGPGMADYITGRDQMELERQAGLPQPIDVPPATNPLLSQVLSQDAINKAGYDREAMLNEEEKMRGTPAGISVPSAVTGLTGQVAAQQQRDQMEATKDADLGPPAPLSLSEQIAAQTARSAMEGRKDADLTVPDMLSGELKYPDKAPNIGDYLADRKKVDFTEQRRQDRLATDREDILNHEEFLRNQQAILADQAATVKATPFGQRDILQQMFKSEPAEFQQWKTEQASPPPAAGEGGKVPKGFDEKSRPSTIMRPPSAQPPSTLPQQTPSQIVPPKVTAPPTPVTAPVTAPASADPLEEIRRQKAMVDAIYPKMPTQDYGQSAIDAELGKNKDRANLLAQLAFFSGITKGAGGSWEGVGAGLAGAGQAHQKGFDRYQTALENRAKRMQGSADKRYSDDTKRSDAAFGLYKHNQDLEKARLTDNRQRIKERLDALDTEWKTLMEANKPGDFDTDEKRKARDNATRNWRIRRQRLVGYDDFPTISDIPERQ